MGHVFACHTHLGSFKMQFGTPPGVTGEWGPQGGAPPPQVFFIVHAIRVLQVVRTYLRTCVLTCSNWQWTTGSGPWAVDYANCGRGQMLHQYIVDTSSCTAARFATGAIPRETRATNGARARPPLHPKGGLTKAPTRAYTHTHTDV